MLALVSMGDAGGDSLALARRGDVCGSPILVSLFPSVPPWCFASAGSAQLGLSLPCWCHWDLVTAMSPSTITYPFSIIDEGFLGVEVGERILF